MTARFGIFGLKNFRTEQYLSRGEADRRTQPEDEKFALRMIRL